jgi:hypothetical protein
MNTSTPNASSELKKTKEVSKKHIFQRDFPSSRPTLLVAVSLQNEVHRDFIITGLVALGHHVHCLWAVKEWQDEQIHMIGVFHEEDIPGYDCLISDIAAEGVELMQWCQKGIVPILPEKNIYTGILTPFNPMKFEGNSFLYQSENPYCIFERFVAYTENIRFPEDKRVLLKNVITTF